MLTVAIVEDDEGEAKVLSECLSRYMKETDELINIKLFTSAFNFIDGYVPEYDIVFMDIEMPDMDGMAAARKLREFDKNVYIIFVTNMAKYAIQGYSVNAYDYFLKPVQYPDLKMRMERIRAAKRYDGLTITVPYQGGVKCFKTNEIYYIESVGHNITFHNADGVFSYRGKSMKQLEEELANYGFSRCNNCFIVNLKYCKEIKDNSVTVGGEELQISRARKKQFMEELVRSFRI